MRLFVGILCTILLIAGLVVLAIAHGNWNGIATLPGGIWQGIGTTVLSLGLLIGVAWGFIRE